MNEQRYVSPAAPPYQPTSAQPTSVQPAPAVPPAAPVTPPPITQEQYEALIGRPKRLNLGKGDTAFAVIAVAVCILCAVFGLFGGMALGYTVTVAACLALLSAYLIKGGRLSALSVVCGLLALGLGAIFVCTTNGSVRFFATVVGFLLGLACFHSMAVEPAVGNRRTAGIAITAAATIGNVGIAVRSLFSGENGEKKAVGKALLGLACSLPIVAIVLPLLLSSDYAFKGMMDNLFSDAVGTIAKSVFGIGLAFPLVSYGLSLKHKRTFTLGESRFGGIEGVYILSFLSVISVIYLMYLFSQLAYFFSAFRGFLPEGDITVAQYARKGFFEMCVIAVINLMLVVAAMTLAKKKNGKVSHPIKAVCSFISLFTLIIIATAVSKMVLYIGSFGMTVLRLTTSAFMVFLAVVFLALIGRIYIRRINAVKTALITAGLILLVLGVGNVNTVCARYNYEAWQSGTLEEIDVAAMTELGDEGVPYLVKLADCTDVEVADAAREELRWLYQYDYFEPDYDDPPRTVKDLKKWELNTEFSRYSLPRDAAYDSLYDYFDRHPEISYVCWEEEEAEGEYVYDEYYEYDDVYVEEDTEYTYG